jgi:hypothetical protein
MKKKEKVLHKAKMNLNLDFKCTKIFLLGELPYTNNKIDAN